MNIFIFWIIIIALILGIYSWRLYRRSPKGFRFQVKLTIIFFLLVLIPSIPLTYFVSGLLTRGVEIFILPGIEESLSSSLDVIKYQLEEKGTKLLKIFPKIAHSNDSFFADQGIIYLIRYSQNGEILSISGTDQKLFENSPFQNEEVRNSIRHGEMKSSLFSVDERPVCEVYQTAPNGEIKIIAFFIDPQIIQAKDKISESLRIHNSLSLFRKSVIEGQIIWGLATIFIIVLVLIAIYAAKSLSRGISEPIKALVSGMQRVSEGNLTHPVEVKAKDEIKFLIDNFNKMTTDLKESQEKLVQAERLAAWQDVARRVSHEIKNVLTPMQLSLRRLRNQLLEGNKPDEKSLLTIQDEVESLRRISEEFTEFARMPKISVQNENINEIITSLVTLIESEPHGIFIKTNLDNRIPDLQLDRTQVRRALHNLVKNGIEASEKGSLITIETKYIEHAADSKIEIAINDQGKGMTPDELSKIFEPYFSTKKRGMGLGLSIVKRIIEDHNGVIQIESKLGTGTRVSICFK